VAFNVENLLPVGSDLDLGTVSQAEYEEKRDRLVHAIDDLLERPDVIGLAEVGTQAILDDLAARLGGYTGSSWRGTTAAGSTSRS
jgi:predicted extracellular nuclease